MTEWQPIETAPKDGTPILIWKANIEPDEDSNVAVGRWSEFRMGEFMWRMDAGDACFGPKLKWMPLPEPPKGDA